MAADLFTYSGKRAVVVGGASGMGGATARLVHDLGGDVVVFDVKDPVDPVGRFTRLDLRDRASIDAGLDSLGDEPVHAVFSCSGIADGTEGIELVNFVGQRHFIESALSRGLVPPGGAIAMISSIGGMGWETKMAEIGELLDTADFDAAASWFGAHPDLVNYTFTKQAVVAYCGRRAPALIREGIRINCTAPGPVMTPLMAAHETWQAFEQGFRATMGVGGAAPEQQAWPLAFLASEAASYISGACLIVDAGFVGGGMTGAVQSPLVDVMLAHRPVKI